ncbi:hypothetical protein SAMN06272735_1063 [Streptomyces sp. TLI_55]|uniref:hypothetical protein n=1 Tax=Streptomyces sp. TLI_55 TaxID=1938861 RepID=UPI000BC48DFB|nr:hypothetical protein [Streptomyces sp. TLI_55]SNX56610.1 hypothetical protein SAMN06272735_1063 [Streptomyces sp. TLI_55]
MNAPRRLALLAVPALLALASCDIPTTGVVEAGEPASGIRPITPVYFVYDDALVAVPRTTAWPGNAGDAVRLLLRGPTPGEAGKRLATEIPERRATPAAPAPTATEPAASDPPRPSPTDAPTDLQGQTPTDDPTADVRGDRITLRLPLGTGPLNPLATRQVICTAAGAHRVTAPSAAPVTVEVTDGSGWHATGTDEDCPSL